MKLKGLQLGAVPAFGMMTATMICLALTAIQTLAQSTYEFYTFTTLAGSALSYGYADGTGSTARFLSLSCVSVDSAGNVYVADSSSIRKVTPAGVVTTLAGKAGNTGSADGAGSAARFYQPSGVAVDGAGNVYVADTYNNTIRKIYPSGLVTTLAGLAGSQGSADGAGSAARFYNPNGVAVDMVGNVYVADTDNNTIRKIYPSGLVVTLAGQVGVYGTMDGTGIAARFNHPSGAAVDGAGNVYVADTQNCTIRKVTSAGMVTTLAGTTGTGNWGSADGKGSAARFNGPFGVAVDNAGHVYVADYANYTIRKVTQAGVVTTLAGQAGVKGLTDGTGSDARFAGPVGVAVDNAGNIYVADQYNSTIRKGYPANVTAVIDTSKPGLGFNGGQFGFLLMGPTGQLVVVEASSNLVNWLPIWTNTFAGARYFSDPQSGVYSYRFYRVRTP